MRVTKVSLPVLALLGAIFVPISASAQQPVPVQPDPGTGATPPAQSEATPSTPSAAEPAAPANDYANPPPVKKAEKADEHPTLATADGKLKAELYGIADIAIVYTNNNPNTIDGNNKAGGETTYVRLASGAHNTSRIGMRGSYALSEDWKAVLRLEKGFFYHNGMVDGDPTTTPFFDRTAALGVEGPYGALYFGRQFTTMYEMLTPYDPMAYAPAFSWLPSTGSATPSTMATKVDNTAKYIGKFPVGGGKLTVGGYYSIGASTLDPQANSGFGGGIEYTVGGFGITALYNQKDSNATKFVMQQNLIGAVRYGISDDALVFKAGYRYFDNVRPDLPHQRSDQFWGGVTVKLAQPLALTGAFYWDVKADKTPNDAWMGVANLDYTINKMFTIYATGAYASAKSDGKAGVTRAGDAAPVDTNQVGAATGIRLKF